MRVVSTTMRITMFVLVTVKRFVYRPPVIAEAVSVGVVLLVINNDHSNDINNNKAKGPSRDQDVE